MFWKSFLQLERRLSTTFQYVEYHNDNMMAYSTEYRSIILQACAEFEVIIKRILDVTKQRRMKELATEFCKKYEKFKDIEIQIPSSKETLTPLSGWPDKLEFWNAYNEIKHGTNGFNSCTLRNARDAIAALFSVNLAYYFCSTDSFQKDPSFSMPSLFMYEGLEPGYLILERSQNIIIPGFNENG